MLRSTISICLSVLALAVSSSIAAAEKVIIGAYPANPPWEYKNDAGVFEGYEIDIITEAVKRLNWEPEFVDMGFQALFAAISSKRIEFAVSTISITPERLQAQSFSQPYYDSEAAIIAREEITSLEQLKGKVVGTLAGTTFEQWVKDAQAELGIAEIKSYQTRQDSLLELANGRTDAGVGDVEGIKTAMALYPNLKMGVKWPKSEHYGIMGSKDSERIGQLNEALSTMKSDGTMAAIYKKWFKTDPEAGSSTVTPMPLPKPE
jgi:polar amino acid transport system substrate-binding protein